MNIKILLVCVTAAGVSACSRDIIASSEPAIIVEDGGSGRRMVQGSPGPGPAPSPALPRMGMGNLPWRAPEVTNDLYREGNNTPRPVPPPGSSVNGTGGPTAAVGASDDNSE